MKIRMTIITGLILALSLAGVAIASPVKVPGTGISIEPLPTWDVDTSGKGGTLLVIKDRKLIEGFPAMIKLVSEDLYGKTPDAWQIQYKTELNQAIKDLRILKQGPVKLGGVDFLVIEFSGMQGKAMLHYLQAIHIQEGKAWIFTGISLERRSDIYVPKFQKMLSSIYFPPPPPGDFVASASTPNSIQLTWKDVSADETAFVIQRQNAADGTWADITNVGPNTTSYTDQNLTCNTEYRYRVKTLNPRGDSNWSGEVAGKTAICVEAPAPPQGAPATGGTPPPGPK